MSSHLEVFKPSGRELVPLTGERVTLGKASTNVVALEHDATVSRLHAILENHGSAWSIRDVGSRNGTFVNGEKITAERVLRSGDEVRIGKSRVVYLEARQSGVPVEEATIVPDAAQLPPRLTRREVDVLMVLCRPLVSDDHVSRAGVGAADGGRAVRDRGSRQTTPAEPVRQVRHPHRGRPPRASGQRGTSAGRSHDRPAARQREQQGLGEVERLDDRHRTFVAGPVRAPNAEQRSCRRRPPPGRAPAC